MSFSRPACLTRKLLGMCVCDLILTAMDKSVAEDAVIGMGDGAGRKEVLMIVTVAMGEKRRAWYI